MATSHLEIWNWQVLEDKVIGIVLLYQMGLLFVNMHQAFMLYVGLVVYTSWNMSNPNIDDSQYAGMYYYCLFFPKAGTGYCSFPFSCSPMNQLNTRHSLVFGIY